MSQFSCRTCGTQGPDNFYKSSKYFCKVCWNHRTAQSGKDKLAELRAERGSKCEKCGYDKCQGALQWHHLDPSIKEFSVGKNRGLSIDQLRTEVSKCQLLCANCHCEAHEKITLQVDRVFF